LLKQIRLLEIASTAVLLAVVVVVVVDLSGVFHAVDSATLQVAHRCTPAPYGMPAVPAALPTPKLGLQFILSIIMKRSHNLFLDLSISTS